MTTQAVIALARKHAGMDESARICLYDAVALYDAGEFDSAKRRALKSLSYSIGEFHPDFKRATR